MTDEQDKPREFWILPPQGIFSGYSYHGDLKDEVVQTLFDRHGRAIVKVIEYSAYEAMRERAERAEADLDKWIKEYPFQVDKIPALEKENSALRERIKKLRDTLVFIHKKQGMDAFAALVQDDALAEAEQKGEGK